jgi:hypothetical protein
LNDKSKQLKDRIVGWLKEESVSYSEKDDPQTNFHLSAKFADIWLSLFQPKDKSDSFLLAAKWTLSKPQWDLLQNNMDEAKRRDLWHAIQQNVNLNNELADVVMGPNPPHDWSELTIYSRLTYADNLTKDRLFTAMLIIRKALAQSVFLLESHAGVLPPFRRGEPSVN